MLIVSFQLMLKFECESPKCPKQETYLKITNLYVLLVKVVEILIHRDLNGHFQPHFKIILYALCACIKSMSN